MCSAAAAPDLAPAGFFTVHEGDARNMDALLVQSRESPLLTCTITSPPYGDLKNYGHPNQIGWGQAHDEYLAEMRRVFRSLHRHTRDDGSLWVIADTLRREDGDSRLWRMEFVPFQLAQEAETAGWVLRDIIVWQKDKTLPWSGRGRLRNAFEYVMLFVKTDKFKYYVDRVRDSTRLTKWWVKWPERYNPGGKVPTNVWEIPILVQGSWKNSDVQHMCPLPPDLVERLILLSTDPGDVVFDPFAGAGLVVAEAERLGRRGVGIELVKRHVSAYSRVTRPEIINRVGTNDLTARAAREAQLADVIPKLRLLKFPRVLLQQMVRSHPNFARPSMAVVLRIPPKRSKNANAEDGVLVRFVSSASSSRRLALARSFRECAGRPPASKFGINADVDVISPDEVEGVLGRKKLFLYRDGRTWSTDGRIRLSEVGDIALDDSVKRWPPIISNVEVNEVPRALF